MTNYGLTLDFLESQIKKVEYIRFGDTGTLCVLTLQNGFTVTGESSCVVPGAFDREIGEEIAYEEAFDKLWEIFGFQEKQRWYEETQLTWLDRVQLEHRDLVKKHTKLKEMLEKGKPDFISPEEWNRLVQQAEAMEDYSIILSRRILAAQLSQQEGV